MMGQNGSSDGWTGKASNCLIMARKNRKKYAKENKGQITGGLKNCIKRYEGQCMTKKKQATGTDG